MKLAVMLMETLLFHPHPTHRQDMVHLIHALCTRRCFPIRPLEEKLIILHLSPPPTTTPNNSTSSMSAQSCLLYLSIAPAMIELSLYLLLSPIRFPSSPSTSPSDLELMANCSHLQNTLAPKRERWCTSRKHGPALRWTKKWNCRIYNMYYIFLLFLCSIK